MPDPSAPQTPTSALVQVPTDSQAAAGQGEFLARNVPAAPLPAGSPQLNVLRDRAASFREQQAAYLKQFADGAVTPFPEIAEARPQHEEQVAALAQSLAATSRETDLLKRETGSKALFAALQPLGPLLKHADYVDGYENILTADQIAEYQRLEAAWESAAVNHPPNTRPLRAVGSSQLYTLTQQQRTPASRANRYPHPPHRQHPRPHHHRNRRQPTPRRHFQRQHPQRLHPGAHQHRPSRPPDRQHLLHAR